MEETFTLNLCCFGKAFWGRWWEMRLQTLSLDDMLSVATSMHLHWTEAAACFHVRAVSWSFQRSFKTGH